MMTCREVLDFLMDYLDAQLSPPQRAAFEEHLAVCEMCVAYLRGYQRTVTLGRALGQEEDAAAPEELVQAILSAKSR